MRIAEAQRETRKKSFLTWTREPRTRFFLGSSTKRSTLGNGAPILTGGGWLVGLSTNFYEFELGYLSELKATVESTTAAHLNELTDWTRTLCACIRCSRESLLDLPKYSQCAGAYLMACGVCFCLPAADYYTGGWECIESITRLIAKASSSSVWSAVGVRPRCDNFN